MIKYEDLILKHLVKLNEDGSININQDYFSYLDGKVIGRATSGGYGHRIKKSLVLAMINPSLIKIGLKVKIDILGTKYDASIINESPYDPSNEKLRA